MIRKSSEKSYIRLYNFKQGNEVLPKQLLKPLIKLMTSAYFKTQKESAFYLFRKGNYVIKYFINSNRWYVIRIYLPKTKASKSTWHVNNRHDTWTLCLKSIRSKYLSYID